MIYGIVQEISKYSLEKKINALNKIRAALHDVSPFKNEPVDFVKWVKNENVTANDYNPNAVAPPEMELLRTSIGHDGFTQPIVSNKEGRKIVVVDGFHRHRVGKEYDDVKQKVFGYLPVVQIRTSQTSRNDRIASTIRHNRARGKHKVDAMSDIVLELKRRNWTDQRICKELGMDQDEVLRLCQISGLTEMFEDTDFSKAWEVSGEITDSDFEELSDDPSQFEDGIVYARTVNTSDENRIFHTYDKWECAKSGFYATTPPKNITKTACQEIYRDFLSSLDLFEEGLIGVTTEWKHSCEHYLTNTAMNRIAWLGQAAACYSTGMPAECRGGFSLMDPEDQIAANELALKYLNKWLQDNGRDTVTMDEAMPSRQSEIY